ncbi:MAG TPA: DinB family protein [Caulobacteraceae bacterium]|jgi:uncharacterized damage-inducible protein DinB
MSDSAVQIFRAMAYNNGWANHRLLSACEALDDVAFTAPRISFFPSLVATLNHILTVDWFYVDALEGGTLGHEAFADETPFKTAVELRPAQRAVDDRLIAVCEGLDDAALEGEVRVHRGEQVQVERRDRLLLHLFQHQIHHRGQAHAMLAGTDVAPPQLDEFFSVMDAPLRAEELGALGWTEERVWGSAR